MAIIKCKMCGGDLNIVEGETVAECEYCGTRQTVPTADNEKKLTLFARANRLRLACEFDKAAGVYENIVAEFPEEAEAYWGLVLCRYGIEYVDDPATGKKIPTCHRSSFDSVMEDTDFDQACENADTVARRVYRDEAKAIEELRKGILEVSGKEEPYDIFICYKETDENGDRTLDSVLAQDIYDALTEKGYRVFFSRISLEDKLGTEYEPYIFAALNSAKLMLAVGTDYEYYNAVWVKNEWSRFLKLMEKDKEKHLIPCFKNLDAYDMPKEFARLQAQDMGKVGAMQDLLRGIGKILGDQDAQHGKQLEAVSQPSAPGVDSLLRRGQLFLEDKAWDSANEYFDKVLDIDPECADAYIGKLCAELNITSSNHLEEMQQPFDNNGNYSKAVRFADTEKKTALITCVAKITERNLRAAIVEAKKEASQASSIVSTGTEKAEAYHKYISAAEKLEKIENSREAAALAEDYRRKAKEIIADYDKICMEAEKQIEQYELEIAETESRQKTESEEKRRQYEELRQKSEQLSVFRFQEKRELESQISQLQEEIFKLRETQTEELKNIRNLRAEARDKYSKAARLRAAIISKPSVSVVGVSEKDRKNGFFHCPICGARNRSNRKVCFECGAQFQFK